MILLLPPPTASTPPTTTPLPRLYIDAELYASEITKTSAKVSWRSFSDYELQYIDGVQVKYTQKNNLVRSELSVFASCSGAVCDCRKLDAAFHDKTLNLYNTMDQSNLVSLFITNSKL